MRRFIHLPFILLLLIMLCQMAVSDVWERMAVDSSGYEMAYYFDLAIDGQGIPHLAYTDDIYLDLRYAVFRNEQWLIEVVDSIGHRGDYCTIAVDAQNIPHICYWFENLIYYGSLGYATLTDTGWVKVIVDTGFDTTYQVQWSKIDMAINHQGHPEVVYAREWPETLIYAYLDANGWHKVPFYEPRKHIYFRRLRIDSQGHPVIAFHEDIGDTVEHNVVMVARLNPADSSWSFLTLPDSIYIYYSLDKVDFALDSQDRIYLTYLDLQWNLKLAMYDGTNWHIDILPLPEEQSGYGYGALSLEIDGNDNPSLAIYKDERLYWGIRTAGQWQYQLAEGMLPHQGVRLAFSPENLPGIAFRATTLNYSRTALFYLRYWPGDPLLILPTPVYDFGPVWTQSYADWDCPVQNDGDAPLIINQLEFTSTWRDSAFSVVETSLPRTILPHQTDYVRIRFRPYADSTFQDTLIIATNDTLSPNRVMVQGTGSSSGTSGNLNLVLKNTYLDHNYGMIKTDIPLAGAIIKLLQSGQLLHGPVTTGSAGQANFLNISPGEYDLRISRQIHIPGDQPGSTLLDSLIIQKPLTIGPGTNQLTVNFPESLFVEKYQQIYDLTHIQKTVQFDVPVTSTFSYHTAESQVQLLLNGWKSQLPPDVAESLGRLVLTENMVYRLFDPAHSIGNELVADIGELINLLINSDRYMPSLMSLLIRTLISLLTGDPLGALISLVAGIIQEFLESQLLQLIGEGILQAASFLPDIAQQIIMAIWQDLTAQFSGWQNLIGGFSSSEWSHTTRLVYEHVKMGFFQLVYIDMLTEDNIIDAKNYSENFQYQGEFSDAYYETEQFISGKRDDVENTQSVCADLRTTAQLFQSTAAILDVLGVLPVPGLSFVEALKIIMKITAYTEVLTAVGLSAYEFFVLPEDMDGATQGIYFGFRKRGPIRFIPPMYEMKKMHPELLARLKSDLKQAAGDYDSTLQSIKSLVQQGKSGEAIVALEDLMHSEVNLKNQMRSTLSPVYAGAAQAHDSLSGFQTAYDSLISSYAQAGMQRWLTYLYIMNAPMDTSVELRNAIVQEIDQTRQNQQTLMNQIDTTLDLVAQLPLPPIVTVSQIEQERYALAPGEKAQVKIRLQNTGSLAAQAVSVRLSVNSALSIVSTDSFYVGTLQPGQSSNWLTWTVEVFDTSYGKGVWWTELHAGNAKTYPASGSFTIKAGEVQTPPTGGRLSNENVYCYPNPFNPEKGVTTLRYSLEKTARVTIRIFDAGGNLVITLLDNVEQQAKVEQSIAWDGRNEKGRICANGTYFFVIESSENERAVGKIAILR